MKSPTLPPALRRKLAPLRRKLRATIAAIRGDQWNQSLWEKATAINARMIEAEREFFDGKEPTL